MADDPKPKPQDQPGDQPGDAKSGDGTDDGAAEPVKEIGGRGGLDPSRYGDWEKNGRCIDF